jgi:hypothetical protein
METIKNPIIKTSFKNKYGETMNVVMDREYNIWFKHDDCNNEYENFKDMGYSVQLPGKNNELVTYNAFKYVMDSDERNVLVAFVNMCRQIAKDNDKTIELTWWDKLSYAN